MEPLKIGILGSGKGTNFRAIADAIAAGVLRAEVRMVISDIEDAGILTLARQRDIPARHIPPGPNRTKLDPAVEKQIAQILRDHGCELVILAGWMRMIKSPLLDAFPRRIINIHPSILPAFPGLEAWKQALVSGTTTTGCTVHYVDAGMDTGEIIAQREVPILPADTPETLHARIQSAEHKLYPEVLIRLAAELPRSTTQLSPHP